MTAAAAKLLEDLRRRRVTLIAEGDELRASAPLGVITEALVTELRGHKAELLAALRREQQIPRWTGPPVLSYAQERIWLHSMLHPGDTAYHLPLRVDCTGRLHIAAVRLALTGLVGRHEVLRTWYQTRRGRPEPVVAPMPAVSLPLVDLIGVPAAQQLTVVRRIETAEARWPFPLDTGPMLRAVLVRLAPERHTILLTRHHIACDGWSLGVLLHELGELYAAGGAGRPHRLPEPALQYSDFAAWQRDPARRAAQGPALDRWVQRLRGASFELAALAVPDADPPPLARSTALTLPPALVVALRAAAQALGSSLFTLVLAGYGWALSRVCGQADLVIGSPVAGRTRVELEPLVGTFSSMLPLRLDLSGRPSLRELVARTRGVVQEALDDQEVPTEQIIEVLRPHRTLADNPLFAAAFTLQNTPQPRVELPGLRTTVPPSAPVMPKFALALTATEHERGLAMELEFDPRRIDDSSATRILSLLDELLRTELDEPLPTGAAPVAAAPPPAVAAPDCVHRLVAAAAARAPDQVAVAFQGRQLSYRALDARASRLAAALVAAGAGPEVPVGLCVEPSLDLVVAALAIVKAGAVYVPIDPRDPASRRAWICADAGIRVAVTRPGLLDVDLPQLVVDDPGQWPAALPARARPPVTPANAAYSIYTSGSTGDPKGVVVTHANLTGMLAGLWAALPELADRQVWSMTASPAFDVSECELWGALTTGGKLVVAPAGIAGTPDELYQLLVAERVTVLNQTPSGFGLLTSVAGRSGTTTALRLVLLGGEACEVARLAPWFDLSAADRPTIVNLYGITETTVHSTVRPITATDVAAATRGAGRSGSPIGRAIPGEVVEVLGPAGEPNPASGKGELYVRGAGVARGYLGRPGLTAERFLPVPGEDAPGGRRYRSGDLAEVALDGELSHLGRTDDQVKLRGYRIEPAEVESVLTAYPTVRAATVVVTGAMGRRFLVGYVVADRPVDEPALRRHVADRLPRHLVPARVVCLDALPLTRNQKVDRAALAARAVPPPAAGRARPRTPTERTLLGLLAELLSLPSADTIGIRDNLFDLGGDSLLVTQFHARIVEVFNVDPPVRRIYQALDVATMGEAVDELVAERDEAAVRSALAEVEAASALVEVTGIERGADAGQADHH